MQQQDITATPKTFINNIIRAYQLQQANTLQQLLKELYFTPTYQHTTPTSWRITIRPQQLAQHDPTVTNNFAKLVDAIREYQALKVGKKWTECFDKHMQAIICLIKLLQDIGGCRDWLPKGLRPVVRATKRVFIDAESNISSNAASARLKNTLLNTLQRFKSARALSEEIKKEYLPLVDVMQISILLSFHNYEQIQRLIYAPKIYGEIPPRYNDNFLFQKGKYALVNEHLKEAEECLGKIRLKTHRQKNLVLRYLIPCRMLLGWVFTPKHPEDARAYAQYLEVSKAIGSCDFALYEELSLKYQKVWLKRGIYLLMDRMRILLWRNLLIRITEATKKEFVEFEVIQKAVAWCGGSEDLNECICIVANLIYQGYVKGYIYQSVEKRTLVLKKGGAFPRLQVIAK